MEKFRKLIQQKYQKYENARARARAWKWRLTKEYLFIFRHLSLCSICVKQDVCSHYSSFIEDILVNGETRGVFEVRGVLWRYCSFYQEGRIPDRGLKVKRL